MSGELAKAILEANLETALKINGVDTVIYDKWQTQDETSSERRGIKAPGENVYFEYAGNTNIERDNVIQIKDSRDIWRVTDVDEGTFPGVKLKVSVIKIDKTGTAIQTNSQGHAVFNAPNFGAVQVGGQGNVQIVSNTITQNPEIKNTIESLTSLINASSLGKFEKEEILSDVDRLDQLTKKEQTAEVAELIKKRLETVKTGIEVAKDGGELALKAAPYLATLWQFFTTAFQPPAIGS
jgi:hypothetical protein